MKILLTAFILLILVGCRDIQCPAFPERLLAYFPYEKSDRLKFKNIDNDTLVFTIKDTDASGPSSFAWNCKCSCGSDAGYETETNERYSLRMNGAIMISNEPYLTKIGCVFYDGDSINDPFALLVTGNNPYAKDNSAFFGDSIILVNEENARISKVTIVEDKGIVEFFDKKENCNWVRIE